MCRGAAFRVEVDFWKRGRGSIVGVAGDGGTD